MFKTCGPETVTMSEYRAPCERSQLYRKPRPTRSLSSKSFWRTCAYPASERVSFDPPVLAPDKATLSPSSTGENPKAVQGVQSDCGAGAPTGKLRHTLPPLPTNKFELPPPPGRSIFNSPSASSMKNPSNHSVDVSPSLRRWASITRSRVEAVTLETIMF